MIGRPLDDDSRYTENHHATTDDFARMDSGDMSEKEEEALYRHLDVCPACKAAFEAWVKNGRPSNLENDT